MGWNLAARLLSPPWSLLGAADFDSSYRASIQPEIKPWWESTYLDRQTDRWIHRQSGGYVRSGCADPSRPSKKRTRRCPRGQTIVNRSGKLVNFLRDDSFATFLTLIKTGGLRVSFLFFFCNQNLEIWYKTELWEERSVSVYHLLLQHENTHTQLIRLARWKL